MNGIIHDFRADYKSLYIGGAFVAPSGGAEETISPITGNVIGSAPLGTRDDAKRALDAAYASFQSGVWADEDRAVRAGKMRQLLDKLIARKEEIVQLMMLEMGYTRSACEGQMGLAFDQLERVIELAARDPRRALSLVSSPWHDGTIKLGSAILARDPIGLVVAITPYNAGFLLGVLKAAPALAAGNSVILKPAPITPLQTLLLTDIMAELDLPAGTFNMVTGGADVGEALCSDPRVDMISFTGSDKVGGLIMAQAAPHITKCHLELGGKSAIIIRHDADFQLALPSALYGNFGQAGQGCACTTRVLVDNRIRAEFVAALKAGVADFTVGDPFEEATVMGPLIRDTARDRTESFVARAIADGATLVHGGKRPDRLGAGLENGFYYEPTIFDDVANDSFLGQNEVFGPIMSVIGFDSDAQAVRMANESDFGLGGAIISRDAGQAMEMALKVRTGMMMINGGSGRLHPDTPFGGYKRSGLGREWGEEGYNEFTQLKSISFPVG